MQDIKSGKNKHYVLFYIFIFIYLIALYKVKNIIEATGMLHFGIELASLIFGIPLITGGVWGNKVGLILIPTRSWMPFKSVKSLNKFYIWLGIFSIVLTVLGLFSR